MIMNARIVVVAVLAVTMISHQSEGSSLKLDQVVRALDALYKRQGDATTEAPTSGGASGSGDYGYTTPYNYGSGSGGNSGSGYYSGERMCQMPHFLTNAILEMKDHMFIQAVRQSTGNFNGICMDIYDWLAQHEYEEEMAYESGGLSSIPDPVSGEAGPSVVNTEGSGTTSAPTKRSGKMAQIKRQLRDLKRQMDGGGAGMSGEYGSGEEEDLNDGDIRWHRLFLSCYVWLHLSEGDYYYLMWKK